jgi:PAS domain S-box-containing protein
MARKEKPDLTKQTPSRQTRPTIGLLCDMTYNEYNLNMWRGVYDVACTAGVNLIYFPGGIMDNPDESTRQARVLYDLVSAETLDGLVIWGAQLGQQIGPQKIQEFCKHYALPVVNIGIPLAGIPSLLVDNCQGMQDVVTHLIEAHHRRRIAFLGGQSNNVEAQERYRGYAQALAAHGLPLEAALVVGDDEVTAYNRRQGGSRLYNTRFGAINFLLDERQLRPQLDFDAVVSYDDNHSIGVVEELQRRGCRVPYDVAVASFDNIEEAGYTTPPLTTANQSVYELGARATGMLLAILQGEKVPEQVVLPTRVIIRQSCGCADIVVKQAAAAAAAAATAAVSEQHSLSLNLTERRELFMADIKPVVGVDDTTAKWAGQLLDAFLSDLTHGKTKPFKMVLEEVIHQVTAVGKDIAAWQGVLSIMRWHIFPTLGESDLLAQAEELWLQAQVLISEMARRIQAYRAFQYDRQAIVFSEIGQKFITTFNIDQLIDMLAEDLPRLGIASAYLSLYNNPAAPTEEARLMLAYNEHGRVKIESDRQNFPARQLAPAGSLPHERPYSFIVEPLYCQQNHLGFVLFEINPHNLNVYHTTLRGQISSALQGALFINERQQAETALQESEHRLKTIMDSAQTGIVMIDAETRQLVDANPAALRMIGAAREQVIGNVCHKFICPAERDHCPICDLGQTVDNSERILLTAQGETVPIIKNVTVVTLMGRQYLLETLVDITEQKQIGAALAKRASELELVTQVSTAVSTILDTQELLRTVVDLTKQGFNLYHAHIYLFDEISNSLVLAAGAGEVGRQMVANRWSIPVGHEHSLVSSAFRSRQGITVNAVRATPNWLPNPLLPDTRSELAVPLIAGERILGVLDVQSTEADHFTEDDIRIQTTLAAQIAVALENARLFEQSQKSDILLRERVKELDCLNDIGREMEETPPPLPELLQWITERIPAATHYPELSVAAIEFDGQVYGQPEAIQLPNQITHGLYIGGQIMGRIYIAHTERCDFIDEESALLGGIATRVSGFIENQRLFEQTRQRATELEETTTFLDSILENIPTVLFVKDAKELRFVRWNRAGEKLLGFDRQEMMGKNDYNFFPKEEADFFIAKDREVLNGGQLLDIPEEPMQTAHGLRLLHTKKLPIYGPDGQPRYLLGISEDITERKQTEEERERLLVEVRRLAAIVENHPDFIGISALDGQVFYINPAGLRMMDLPPDYPVSSMTVRDFYPNEDAAKLIEQGLPTALEKGFWSTEANVLKADGTTVPVEQLVSINYDADDNAATIGITMHDITNRKIAAAEQSRLLAESQAAYRQFVRREWEKYLQEQHQGRWRIEHRQMSLETEPTDEWLTAIQTQVLQEGKTRVVKGIAGDGENPVQPATMVAPITLRDQVIGTLNLHDIAPDRAWTAEEIALVEAVSEQLALTVENLRLFDDTQRRASREQLTRRITDKMHAAPDVDTIIQAGISELAKALGVSRTYVKLTPAQNREK